MKPKKASNKRKPLQPSYSADRPIKSISDDLLGRGKFASQLIDDIHTWEATDSLVIALYGAWGSGKTSLKNMVLELNEAKGGGKLPVFEFNPWQLSGTGHIADRFFKELSITLGRTGAKRDIEQRAQRFDAYSKMIAVGGNAFKVIGKAMPLFGVPGGTVMAAAGDALASAGESADLGGKALASKALIDTKTIDEVKAELSAELLKRKLPLLVVIDDIDRLSMDEILEVFQVVKANADFPKIIYLLLFERKVVAKALDKISDGNGMEFLEKIIQVGYHIPNVTKGSVENVLFASLNKLIDQTPAEKYWNKHRWREIYPGGISGYLGNLRQVYRYIASLNFHFRHHISKRSIEVNPIDLIVLEVLRVFEPELYEKLPGAKALLTRDEPIRMFGKVKQEIVDKGLDQLLALVPDERRNFARTILCELFPPLGSNYSEGVSGSLHGWLREARICCAELFDKYFSLSVSSNDITQAEMDELLASRANPAKFCSLCAALQKRTLIKTALERLDAHKEDTPIDQMEPFIEALSNISDSLPPRAPGLFEVNLGITVFRLAYFGLKREPDTKKRLKVLVGAFQRSRGLSLCLDMVNAEMRDRAKSNEGLEHLLDENQANELRDVCLQKVRKAAKTSSLKSSGNLKEILYDWARLASDEPKKWLAPQIKDVESALWLLELLLSESHSWGNDHRVSYGIQLGAIEKFADLAVVESFVPNLKKMKLTVRWTPKVRQVERLNPKEVQDVEETSFVQRRV